MKIKLKGEKYPLQFEVSALIFNLCGEIFYSLNLSKKKTNKHLKAYKSWRFLKIVTCTSNFSLKYVMSFYKFLPFLQFDIFKQGVKYSLN